MKKCKILHINDGSYRELVNGDFHLVEDYPWAEDYINKYLEDGYEVKQMIPIVTPNVNKEGCFAFFRDGFTLYLEKNE